MTHREVVRRAIQHEAPPYVPWELAFTREARLKLDEHLAGRMNLSSFLDNHFQSFGSGTGAMTHIGDGRVRDSFGVVWNQTVDKDIGVVEGCLLPEPTLHDLRLPDPDAPVFQSVRERMTRLDDRFRVFSISFTLYERAWTLRGMENLMMDFLENPTFVRDLFDALADFNISLVKRALEFDIDAVYFGDDFGQQHGLQMGRPTWEKFIAPVLRRMYGVVRDAGKFVMIHSCGDVDELFDDLVAMGVNCFNPFQPEVMDVRELMPRYRGRLAFHGGLSTQRTLPNGTPADVRRETEMLLRLGSRGGYIFAPAHAVEGDVKLEHMLAFIETVQGQPGYKAIVNR